MNRTIPLSQFMPYGAPELLAAAPRHLSRAVMASSSLAVAAFFVALALAPLWAPAPPHVISVEPRIQFAPPVSVLERVLQRPAEAPALPRGVPDHGVPLPVPEAPEPTPAIAPESPPVTTNGEAGTQETPIAPSAGVTDAESLPDRDAAIYVEELPAPVTEIRPVYPPIAQQAGVEGLVIVRALVGKDGRVLKAVVDEKFSIPLLDEAALEAARRWVFKPALMNSKPVPVWVVLRFNFRLHER